MPEIQFVFTPGDNVKPFPKPISGKYELMKLVIEAESLTGLIEAIRKMRIYFRFDFGSTAKCDTKVFHLSKYIFAMDTLLTTIDFNNLIIEINPKYNCTNAIVSIQDEVVAPVIKMTLILNHIELE